jgi:hypothetical protein
MMPPIGGAAPAGIYRGKRDDPCQPQQSAYEQAVAKQRQTQNELNRVNSPQAEREINKLQTTVADQKSSLAGLQAKGAKAGQTKILRDNIKRNEKRIADWQASARKAMDANVKAGVDVDKAFKKLQKCKDKHA